MQGYVPPPGLTSNPNTQERDPQYVYLPDEFNCDHFYKLIKVYNAIVQSENIPTIRIGYVHVTKIGATILLHKTPNTTISDEPAEFNIVDKIMTNIMNSHYIININKFEMTWLNGIYKAYMKKGEDRVKALMERYADKTIDASLYGKVQVGNISLPGGTAMQHNFKTPKNKNYAGQTCPPKKTTSIEEIRKMLEKGLIKPKNIVIDHITKINNNDPNDFMSPDRFKSIKG